MRRKRTSWTSDEIKFIKENYGFFNCAEIAEKLNRPTGSVYNKIKRDGITKNPTQKEFAVYDDDKLKVIGTAQHCADFLDVKVETFKSYATQPRKRDLIILDIGYWPK